MSPSTTHDEVRAALAAEALDALTGDERRAVLAHLRECAECRAELGALRDAAASLGALAPPVPLEAERSARVRARLLARAAADAGARGDAAPPAEAGDGAPAGVLPIGRARRAGPGRAGWWAAAAAAVVAVGMGAWAASLRGRVAGLDARVAGLERVEDELRRGVEARDLTLAGLTGPSVRVIDLAAAGPRAPSGRMFWDVAADRWTFVAHDLPAAPAGRTYQLWLVTPGRKLSAGTFVPGPGGRALVQATFALPADSLRAVAVTEEPEGGVPQPTGRMVIVGAMTE